MANAKTAPSALASFHTSVNRARTITLNYLSPMAGVAGELCLRPGLGYLGDE
jgi:hypothetical protein